MLGVFDGFVVASASRLDDIIMVFRVSFEGYFSVAIGAFEIEPKNLDAEVDLFVADLHSHVELGPNVQIISAGVAPQTHGQHISHHH